ncbi:hypothetical protein PENSPDRAFT_659252 [Peniophora sp. CONT]|nr:hypothetical protein PENSPDRAFT_659252 [Peniophora sp. CONT]
MSTDQYTEDAVSALSSTIIDKAPYFGSLPLPAPAFELFFKDKNGQAHSVNLASAATEQLSALAEACSVAPFGRGAESVVDDTYRKAGKLDLPNFAIPFQPEGTALGAGIRECVLGGAESKRPVRFELYKLNVYGEGDFFKAHKDTPRGGAMFGSLVLVYPTVHSGGALAFRHRGQEWTFDSASAVYQDGSPALGYAAFYSDVEHEVLPVTSGYRVTITYNLYFDDAKVAQPASGPFVSDFANRLQNLLDDPHFMPQGGYLGFGLRHAYPIEFSEEFTFVRNGVQHIASVLKGSDAAVLRAAQAAGLSTRLHVAYDCKIYNSGRGYPRERTVTVLARKVVGGDYVEGGMWELLKEEQYGGVTLWPKGDDKCRVERTVHWVTPRTGASRVKSVVMAYGNEASLDYKYSELCLLVAVGKAGARTAKKNLVQDEKDRKYHVYGADSY